MAVSLLHPSSNCSTYAAGLEETSEAADSQSKTVEVESTAIVFGWEFEAAVESATSTGPTRTGRSEFRQRVPSTIVMFAPEATPLLHASAPSLAPVNLD